MRRLEALDGMRGYFLVFMMLNHLSFSGGYLLVKLNHGELGFVQDAQGFVFLSGLLIGMVYTGHMSKRGYAAGAARIRHRALELYGWAMGCLAAVLALGLVIEASETFWEPWLWQLAHRDVGFAAAAALLLYQPTYMDILPQYIVYLLVAPPLVWACINGHWRTVAAGSFLLWLLVQFGFHLPVGDAISAAMGSVWPDLVLRAHFNVLAWQVVFMGGMVLGTLTVTGAVDWRRVFDPERPVLAYTALAVVLLFMVLRLGFTWQVMPEVVLERFRRYDVRGEFSLVYLLNFAALAYLVGFAMIAGPNSQSAALRGVARVLHGVFTLSFLRLIGRHSLQVYVWHVLVIYALKGLDHHHGPFDEATKTAIALTAVASLALPAFWREFRLERARQAKAAKVA